VVAGRALLVVVAAAGACGSEGEDGGAVHLTAWTIGPEPSAYTRKSNLVEGARRLNQELAGRRVELAADFATTNNDAYGKKLVFAFASGHGPDIVCGGHEIVGQLAPAGYLAPLDALLAARERFRADFFPLLWDAVRYGGRIYGVPQDNEVRLTFVRKDLLRRIGWSEARIEGLAGMVEAGQFTLDDLAALAEEAVRTGAVARGSGVWHRNRTGFDWLQFPLAEGGALDGPGGALVLSRAAAGRTVAFFDRLTDGGATPPGMMSYPNRTAYAGFVEGRVLVYLTGGSWHKREWQESFGLSDAAFRASITYFPIPAARCRSRTRSPARSARRRATSSWPSGSSSDRSTRIWTWPTRSARATWSCAARRAPARPTGPTRSWR
jgi:inositol-phosphate transport system substrate-binding protein